MRWLSILVLALALVAAGCGGGDDESSASDTTTIEETTDTTTEDTTTEDDPYLKPFQVAIVVVMRDGRITGLRPTEMMFAEPAAAAITLLPGRPLPRERLPGEPEPVATPVAPAR